MGLGFLNQPFYGCPEEEGKRGPGFADYTASPWSPVAGLFFAIFFQRHSGFLLPFFFFKKSFWYLLLRERIVYMCVGTGGPRGGATTQEKETQKQNDLEGSDRQTDRQTDREGTTGLLYFHFCKGREGRNRMHSGLSTKSKYLFCLVGDSHWNHTD